MNKHVVLVVWSGSVSCILQLIPTHTAISTTLNALAKENAGGCEEWGGCGWEQSVCQERSCTGIVVLCIVDDVMYRDADETELFGRN